jgi:hypothetical protein
MISKIGKIEGKIGDVTLFAQVNRGLEKEKPLTFSVGLIGLLLLFAGFCIGP